MNVDYSGDGRPLLAHRLRGPEQGPRATPEPASLRLAPRATAGPGNEVRRIVCTLDDLPRPGAKPTVQIRAPGGGLRARNDARLVLTGEAFDDALRCLRAPSHWYSGKRRIARGETAKRRRVSPPGGARSAWSRATAPGRQSERIRRRAPSTGATDLPAPRRPEADRQAHAPDHPERLLLGARHVVRRRPPLPASNARPDGSGSASRRGAASSGCRRPLTARGLSAADPDHRKESRDEPPIPGLEGRSAARLLAVRLESRGMDWKPTPGLEPGTPSLRVTATVPLCAVKWLCGAVSWDREEPGGTGGNVLPCPRSAPQETGGLGLIGPSPSLEPKSTIALSP